MTTHRVLATTPSPERPALPVTPRPSRRRQGIAWTQAELFVASPTRPTRGKFTLPSAKALRRTRPERATSVTAQAVLRSVALFGILPTSIAVQLGRSHTRHSLTAHYAAARALIRAGVLNAIPFTTLGVNRAPGLGQLLLAGPQWHAGMASIGLVDDPLVTVETPNAVLAEQLTLAADCIRRAAMGGRVLTGTAWLEAAGAWKDSDSLSPRLELVERARAAGRLVVPEALRLCGVVPPSGMEGVTPILYLGGTMTPLRAAAALLEAVALVAPIEVCLVRRAERKVEQLRRLMNHHLRTPAYCGLTLLPRARGTSWDRFWERVATSVGTAVDRQLTPDAGTSPEASLLDQLSHALR